ncbi:DUF4349 domain-containing protein [Mycolicibacterium sediminis]|uniref:DUF4349 domain-containing protein n=2 Tax=Mycolicibacterium sediminis TaxID=1286180 RepID=A0A7I7QQ50_9MYCO|nr:hypothetical protein MSEDJ_25010 [Mycolicibacterium sediminis]
MAVALLTLLMACSGSPREDGPVAAGGGTADGVSAPAPLNGPPEAPKVARDVVKTASLTITVADVSAAADEAAVEVEKAGGRVDSRSEDAGSGQGRAHTAVVLRAPVAKLDGLVRTLKGLGEVQTADTTAEDVTAQRVDLDARITALQTSVERLLAIMRDARDPDALIKAEDALSQRQADLDSLRAQRDQLGDQIAYSTVDVTFVAERIGGPAPKQYDGFLGQVERGWDGLVSVVGQLVLLVGLLLPWLGVLAVVGGIGYVVVRFVLSRRS